MTQNLFNWRLLILSLISYSLVSIVPVPSQALELALASSNNFKIGDTISVDVTIDSALSLYGVALDLAYDKDIVSVVDSDEITVGVQPEITEGPALDSDGEVTFLRSALVDQLQGRLVVGNVRAGQVAGIDIASNQTIMTITFKAIAPGSIEITSQPKTTTLRNGDLRQIPIDSLIGTSIVITLDPGDIAGNGAIDLTDVILALQVLSGFDTGNMKIYSSADVNGDNRIGVEEAIYDMNYIANNP